MIRRTERLDSDKDISEHNFSLFKECLASRVIFSLTDSDQGDDRDLDEFSLYLAEEAWSTLPLSLRLLTHSTDKVPEIEDLVLDVPASLADSLVAYGIISLAHDSDIDAPHSFLRHVLASYVPLAITPPPPWSSTRTSDCEICQRAVPLTYHHLIPRSTHTRVLKRGWHAAEMLGSVAWLCRPCHTAVHSVASNEELAREYYTVERLMARPDIQRWATYAAKQRCGVRR